MADADMEGSLLRLRTRVLGLLAGGAADSDQQPDLYLLLYLYAVCIIAISFPLYD